MEKKKGLPHFICEKVPVLAIVLGIIIPLLIFSSTDGIGNSMFGEGALFYLFTAFLGAVFIALVRLWFLPDYKGAARLNASFAEVTRILIPFFFICGRVRCAVDHLWRVWICSDLNKTVYGNFGRVFRRSDVQSCYNTDRAWFY